MCGLNKECSCSKDKPCSGTTDVLCLEDVRHLKNFNVIKQASAYASAYVSEETEEDYQLATLDIAEAGPRIRWVGPMAYLGSWVGKDPKRRILEVEWAKFPLTFYAQFSNAQGHEEAFAAGTIDNIWVDGETVMGTGLFSRSKDGLKALQLVIEGTLRGISIDVRDGDYEAIESEDGFGVESFTWITARIGSATLVGLPAFENARIEILADDYSAVRLASAKAKIYDAKYFDKIDYDKLTDFSMDPQTGEITGHMLVWGRVHRGIHGTDWVARRTYRSLHNLMVGRTFVKDEQGEVHKLRTLTITAGGRHAPMHDTSMSPEEISKFVQGFSEDDRLEDVRCQVAQVVCWEDEFGLAVHGMIQPWTSQQLATQAFAGCVSVDERGQDTLFGVHFVNTCAFLPVTEEEEQAGYRMVASAGIEPEVDSPEDKPEGETKYGIANLKVLEESKRKVQETNFAVTLAKLKNPR